MDIALTCYFNYCSNEEILNFSECLYNKSLNIKKCKHVPNEETIKAMEESKNGNLKKYSSLDELWKDLMSDD